MSGTELSAVWAYTPLMGRRPDNRGKRSAQVAQCAADALVLDAGVGIAVLQEEGAERFVVRCAKNSMFRRTQPPA